MRAELESKELLTFCVKKVKGLGKVKLIDAGFIWTEPHSRRLKLKLTIQAEVLNGAILQQTFVVEVRSLRACVCACARACVARHSEVASRRRPPRRVCALTRVCVCACVCRCAQFVVEPHMCEQCQRSNTNSEVWLACVQARVACTRVRTLAHTGAHTTTLALTCHSFCCERRCARRWSTSAPSSSSSSSSSRHAHPHHTHNTTRTRTHAHTHRSSDNSSIPFRHDSTARR
jgi:hypothetical protein